MRLKSFCNISILKSYYYGYMFSRLKYGILFWGSASNLDRIFKLQKRAIRNIYGISSRQSCKPLFIKYNIMTVPCIYMMELLTYIKSNLSRFHRNSTFHNYSTRNNNSLAIPTHNTALYEKSLNYISIKLYNKSSSSVKNIVEKSKYVLYRNRLNKFINITKNHYYKNKLSDKLRNYKKICG